MSIRGSALALAVVLTTGCAGMAPDSSLGLAGNPAEQGALAQLMGSTSGRSQLGQACYTVPRGKVSMGPTATYCVHTSNGFLCMPECRRER